MVDLARLRIKKLKETITQTRQNSEILKKINEEIEDLDEQINEKKRAPVSKSGNRTSDSKLPKKRCISKNSRTTKKLNLFAECWT